MDENDVRPAAHLSPTPCVELWKGEFRQFSGDAHRTILRFESASCDLGHARCEERMSTSPAREFHGRDAELAQVRAELERRSANKPRAARTFRARRSHAPINAMT
jgi:hypothetical protein